MGEQPKSPYRTYAPADQQPGQLAATGIHGRMLVDGGQRVETRHRVLRGDNGVPRMPKENEPDPNDSDQYSTGTLVRYLIEKRHWTVPQVHLALMDRANKGGLWYRWQTSDDLLDRWAAGNYPLSSTPAISRVHFSSTPAIGGVPTPAITPPGDYRPGASDVEVLEDGFHIIGGIVDRILAFVENSPPMSTSQLVSTGPLTNEGFARRYLRWMVAKGMIHMREKQVLVIKGRKRECTVVHLGPAPVTMTHQEFEQLLPPPTLTLVPEPEWTMEDLMAEPANPANMWQYRNTASIADTPDSADPEEQDWKSRPSDGEPPTEQEQALT